MRQLIFPVIALAGALVAVVPAIDLAAAPKPANPRVKVTFTDGGTDQIRSDSLGPYEDGNRNVTAYIDASTGVLNFWTGGEKWAERRFQYLFGSCIGDCLAENGTPSGPYQMPVGAPYPDGLATGSFQAGVRATNGTALPGALLGMPEGTPMRSGVKINIPLDQDADFWTVCLTPRGVDGFCGLSQNSTPAHIIRNAPGQWEIWSTSSEIAELINEVSARGKVRIVEYLGTYHMPFRFTVACVANCPSSSPQ
jgi:hypothetical protein